MRSDRRLIWLLALVGLLALPSATAAAPANDDFAAAAEMTGLPAEATGSNVDATREPDEPNHGGGSGERSIWFRWRAPRDAGVTALLGGCPPPFTDATLGSLALSVYEQTAKFGLVEVVRSGGPFRAESGQTYFVAVDTPSGQPPDPDICLRLLPGPANDDFGDARQLTGFPASASQRTNPNEGAATREPGEPNHGGSNPSTPSAPPASVWYSWTAPGDGRVRVRVCGTYGPLAVYTGDRVDALTWLRTRHGRERGCGGLPGASVTLDATRGEVYRIAVTPSESFQVLVENQVSVVTGDGKPSFLYTAFPGDVDDVELRLTGSGAQRALLLEAGGVSAANGCQPDAASRALRCPVPGRAGIAVAIDLGDGDDRADVRLPGPVASWSDERPTRHVLGGDGDDTLSGSAGSYSLTEGWVGELVLFGEAGADRLRGGRGDDSLRGGPGPDEITGGAGSDGIDAGPGDDRVRTRDRANDRIRCAAGRDRVRLDGFDLTRECEHRSLGNPGRAVATSASFEDDGGDGIDYLAIRIVCPIDAKNGCRTRVAAAVTRRRTIARRIRLAPGRTGWVRLHSVGGAEGRLLRRGMRVTVSTARRGRTALKFTRHLPVWDNRYHGE